MSFCPCRVQLGTGGSAVCIETCLCAAAGWPFSPLLACYVCLQRRYLHRIYPSDIRWSCSDLLCGLFWPLAIVSHQDLVDSKEAMGLLHYPWAYGLPAAARVDEGSSLIKKQILFIMGPPNSGKSTLLKKLCAIVATQKPIDHQTDIDIQVAAVPHSNSGPFTLEIWDIPQKCLGASLRYDPDFVFLTYDSGDKDSLSGAKDIYNTYIMNWTECKCIHLVATKIDTWEGYGDSDIGPYELTGAQWRASCIELAIEAEQWSKENKALQFSLVSSPMNEGVMKLLRSVSLYDDLPVRKQTFK